MSRRPGQRNPDHARIRSGLLARITTRILAGERLRTFSDLARAAEVSRPTLKHYFGDVRGVMTSLLASWSRDEPMSGPRADTAEDRLLAVVLQADLAWRHGYGRLLVAGLDHHHDRDIGAAVVVRMLEPIISAMEQEVRACIAAGLLPPTDERSLAVGLVSPVLVLGLHQDTLHGSTTHPVDRDKLLRQHVATLVRGVGQVPGR